LRYVTIIFDLDGTVSDPSGGISRSVNYVLETFGYGAVEARRVRQMIGPPLTEIFEHFLGPLPEERLLELVAAYRERYATVGYAENVVYEDIPEAVSAMGGGRLISPGPQS